jgi:hypothetical protein
MLISTPHQKTTPLLCVVTTHDMHTDTPLDAINANVSRVASVVTDRPIVRARSL